MNHAFAVLAEAGSHVIVPRRIEGGVGHSTAAVSKQSLRYRYVADIAAVSFLHTVTPHWANGFKQLAHSCYPRSLESRVTMLTTALPSHQCRSEEEEE